MLKLIRRNSFINSTRPAAFGRLCVETAELKYKYNHGELPAAFGRLCVETKHPRDGDLPQTQPPSGGCVLKLQGIFGDDAETLPAAFGRLCVETCIARLKPSCANPAAFGRLCVETRISVGI